MAWFSRKKSVPDFTREEKRKLTGEQKKRVKELKKRLLHSKSFFCDGIGAFLQNLAFARDLLKLGALEPELAENMTTDVKRIKNFYKKKMKKKQLMKDPVSTLLLPLVEKDFMKKFLELAGKLVKLKRPDQKMFERLDEGERKIRWVATEFRRALSTLVSEYHSLTGGYLVLVDKRGNVEEWNGTTNSIITPREEWDKSR